MTINSINDSDHLLKRWQTADDDAIHERIWPIVQVLAMSAAQRHESWRKYERIYGWPYWQDNDPIGAKRLERRMRVNRCRLHVETYVSRWMKSRVLPMVVCKGGDFALKRKAKKHNALIEGAFESLGVFDNDPKWCRDATMYGTGWAFVGDDGEEPMILRCDPFSVLLDDLEWLEGSGKTIHWVRLRPKDELIAEWPEHRDKIMNASGEDFPHVARHIRLEGLRQICPVVFSWSLAIGKEGKPGYIPGKHAVCINGATLHVEEFDEDELPFAQIHRSAPQESVWGEPLMADLAPIQETLDRYLKRVDESLWLTNVIKLLVRKGANLNQQKLINLPATILEVENMTDIQSFNGEISPQLMQFVNFGMQTMQELGRANIMSTTGDMPKNIRAYSAMKLLEDTDMEGLREGLRSRDSFFVKIGRLLIKSFERLGGYKLMVRKGKEAEMLDYRKIKLPKNSYTWSVMPTAFLAKTAEGRMDQAEWLVDQGLLPKDRVAHFIDFPDLESETSMAMAQTDAVQYRIEKIIEDGEYVSPHPFLNLSLLRKLVGDAIARAEADSCPEDRIELLRQLVIDAAALQSAASAPPGGPAGAAGAPASPGAPVAPPGAMQPPTPPATQPPPPAPPAGMPGVNQ